MKSVSFLMCCLGLASLSGCAAYEKNRERIVESQAEKRHLQSLLTTEMSVDKSVSKADSVATASTDSSASVLSADMVDEDKDNTNGTQVTAIESPTPMNREPLIDDQAIDDEFAIEDGQSIAENKTEDLQIADADAGDQLDTDAEGVETEESTDQKIVPTMIAKENSVAAAETEEVPVKNADTNDEPAEVPSVAIELVKGETLWSFSRRTTGSGLNWPKIADLNEMENPDRVEAGDKVLVPVELVLISQRP